MLSWNLEKTPVTMVFRFILQGVLIYQFILISSIIQSRAILYSQILDREITHLLHLVKIYIWRVCHYYGLFVVLRVKPSPKDYCIIKLPLLSKQELQVSVKVSFDPNSIAVSLILVRRKTRLFLYYLGFHSLCHIHLHKKLYFGNIINS